MGFWNREKKKTSEAKEDEPEEDEEESDEEDEDDTSKMFGISKNGKIAWADNDQFAEWSDFIDQIAEYYDSGFTKVIGFYGESQAIIILAKV